MGCGLSSVEMVKFGMFSVATVGVVHIGEALEVYITCLSLVAHLASHTSCPRYFLCHPLPSQH